ncbi:copper transporter [Brevibacterium litoralis]|uniref:copper transporter n=1 Tax=Brevibacterium litoralis TaxID=3138935 RepID=UPI0032EE7E2D
MIDFRYHLVSLISVFLALAVGIVLGAGPLRGPIGESLQTQVDSLRDDRDRLRLDLDAAGQDVEALDSYVAATAADLLDGTLTGAEVALVVGPGVEAATVDAVSGYLEDAGATTAGSLTLRDGALLTEGAEDLHSELLALDPSLSDEPGVALPAALSRAWGSSVTPGASLADGAATAEETADAESTDTGTDESAVEAPVTYDRDRAQQVLDLFADAGRAEDAQVADADAVLLLAPVAPRTEEAEPSPTTTAGTADSGDTESEEDTAATPSPAAPALDTGWADLTRGLGQAGNTALAGTTDNASSGALAEIRAENSPVVTVDGLERSAGPVLAVLGTSAAHTGTDRDYGFLDTADAVAPDTIALRTVVADQGAGTSGTEGSEGSGDAAGTDDEDEQ